MNVRDISRTAVSSYLRLTRLPLDTAISLLPGKREGSSAPARLALDRADAAVRALAATLLRDPKLYEDAQRRRAAAQERERALKLRGEAARRNQQADATLDQRQEQAQRRRTQADARADARREAAAREQQQKTQRAAEAERARVRASRAAQERAEEKIEEQAPRQRLGALETEAQAQREQQEALAESAEAGRLGDAAARVKAQRKASNGNS